MSDIDWSVFDKFPEDLVVCKCGAHYRSHAQFSRIGTRFGMVSRKPCPDCGGNEASAVYGVP